ncbi:MAG: hypothetical protein IKH31_05470 [Clostridia bacterium]|nr:hypothetical protein [Clostridia bacterium]
MKKYVALLLTFALLCLLPAGGALADEKDAGVPENVTEYARDTAAPLMKAYMKDPGRGYIGNVFSSAEEIDALTLGKGYRLYVFDIDKTSISASAVPVEEWLFSLDGSDGAKVFFTVTLEPETGSFDYYGAEDAENLSAALGIMERLAAKEGVEFAPVIRSTMSGFVVAQSFKSSDRVITVPGSATKLDAAYLEVKSSDELPSFEEYVTEYMKTVAQYSADSAIQLAELPTGSGTVELSPRLNAGSADKGGFKPYLVPAIACAAVLAAAAAAVLIVLKRKKVK